MSNRLAQETSPYLLQHADNPVDWYPWGEEAFAKAKAEDKPILLSIGYAACHWCHVMAHESFEDEETAEIMNDLYVNVKVDREERPDVDQIYMSAVVAMTGQGGWPMTVAMTPDGRPFFGGTYYPKTPRYGMPSFQQVLTQLRHAWDNRREDVYESADGIADHISQGLVLAGQEEMLDKGMLNRAIQGFGTQFDRTWGGFGQAPKFPQPMNLEFLVRAAMGTGDEKVTHMLIHTLDKMARGGMYDQIGGGFARYSVDAKWLVPHFEKMLYDNGQLARVYLHAYQITGREQFKHIVTETLDYTLREMTHEDGGFYSSLDADSEGEEGKFYVWTLDELREVLGDEAELISLYYDISAHGNWEGNSIPNMPRTHAEVAKMVQMDEEALREKVHAAREILYSHRAKRIWPGLDDKVLTAWNGLMLAAFAEAGRVLGNEAYTQAAVKNAEFLYDNMRADNGRLLRTWKAGSAAKYNAYLEDYAFLADGLIALYQTTFDERWFSWAHELTEMMIAHFTDENGGFYDTSDDHEALIFRPKDVQDNAIPSGNGMAAGVLLKMGMYTGNGRYYNIAYQMISSMYAAMSQYPTGFGQWLQAATLILNQPKEIAIIGDPHAADTQALLETTFAQYRPYQVVAVGTDGDVIELLAERPLKDGRATAYVCENFVCQLPVNEPAELEKQL